MNITLLKKIICNMSIKCVIGDSTYIFKKQEVKQIDSRFFSLVDAIDDIEYKFSDSDNIVTVFTYADCYPTFRDIGNYEWFLDKKEKQIIENNKAFDVVIDNLRKILINIPQIKIGNNLVAENVKNITIARKTLSPIIPTTLKLLCLCKNIPESLSSDDLEFIFSSFDNKSKITSNVKVIAMSVLFNSKDALIDNLGKEKINNPNDMSLHEEIDVIISIVNESVTSDTFRNSNTIEDLINAWPSILLPVPFK